MQAKVAPSHLFSRKILWSLIPLHWISSWVDMLWAQVFFLYFFFFFFNLFIFNFTGELVFVLLQWECDELKLMWLLVEVSEQFMNIFKCSFLQLNPRSPWSVLYPRSVLSDDDALISVCEGDGGNLQNALLSLLLLIYHMVIKITYKWSNSTTHISLSVKLEFFF